MAFLSLSSFSKFRVANFMPASRYPNVMFQLSDSRNLPKSASNLELMKSKTFECSSRIFLIRSQTRWLKTKNRRKLHFTQTAVVRSLSNGGGKGEGEGVREGEGDQAGSLLPLERLQNAKVIYAAAPSMGHNQEGHPESNQRIPQILKALEDSKLTSEGRGQEIVKLEGFSPATLQYVQQVHHANYMRGLEKAMETAEKEGLIFVESSGPTYATSATYSECMYASGAGLAVVDSVVAACQLPKSTMPAGFALVRPPGHHAVPKGPMGFCLIDHIAVAAKYAQMKHKLKRVMIIDFDVHHGNGTHDIFYNDPDVFFLSTHQEGSYPGTGKMAEVGEGEGEGYTLNLPLPGGAGNEAMAVVLDEVISPSVQRFKPDIILVSAGYDAHFLDPLAGLQFTTGTYYGLTCGLQQLAKQYCNGRIVFFLEGGYDLMSLSNSVADTFRAFLGSPSLSKRVDNPALLYDEPSLLVRSSVDQIKSIHSL